MKWGVLFSWMAKVLLGLVVVIGASIAVLARSFLWACLVVAAGLCLAKGQKIRTRWLLAISGGLTALLVVLFLVTVDNALHEAMALKIAVSGKALVLSIISGSNEREAVGESPLWPSIEADFSGATNNYAQAPNAETYFSDLVALPIPNLGWFHFAGGGVPTATNHEDFVDGDRNLWNVIAGLDEDASDATPFLFSRNLDISIDDLRDDNVNLRKRLDARKKPFGREFVVLVRKGGAKEVLKRRDLTREAFLGGTVFNSATNRHATVLKAKIRTEKEGKRYGPSEGVEVFDGSGAGG